MLFVSYPLTHTGALSFPPEKQNALLRTIEGVGLFRIIVRWLAWSVRWFRTGKLRVELCICPPSIIIISIDNVFEPPCPKGNSRKLWRLSSPFQRMALSSLHRKSNSMYATFSLTYLDLLWLNRLVAFMHSVLFLL